MFPPFSAALSCTHQAFFFSRDTLELVKRVELPGSPSSYHIVNGFQERGERGTTTVVIAKHRDGGREKLEKSFRDMMNNRCVRRRYAGQNRLVWHGDESVAPFLGHV